MISCDWLYLQNFESEALYFSPSQESTLVTCARRLTRMWSGATCRCAASTTTRTASDDSPSPGLTPEASRVPSTPAWHALLTTQRTPRHPEVCSFQHVWEKMIQIISSLLSTPETTLAYATAYCLLTLLKLLIPHTWDDCDSFWIVCVTLVVNLNCLLRLQREKKSSFMNHFLLAF